MIDHLRRLGREPELVEETLKEAHRQIAESLARFAGERKRLEAESRRVQFTDGVSPVDEPLLKLVRHRR